MYFDLYAVTSTNISSPLQDTEFIIDRSLVSQGQRREIRDVSTSFKDLYFLRQI